MNFEELRVDERIVRATREMKFETATPIQEKVIPLILQGIDVVGQAQTGTGKTAAFAMPLLQLINQDRQLQVLVLVPTRELAVQVAKETRDLGKYCNVNVLEVYGGTDIEKQIQALQEGAQIVVATPGRVLDHLKRYSINLSTVRFVVLDEADRMLDMGFIDDVEYILEKTPQDRQTLLFSATMPGQILELTNRFMVSPEVIRVSEDKMTVEGIKQFFVAIEGREKIDTLCTVLKTRAPTLSIIFCRTKMGADRLEMILRDRGFNALSLHGNLSQARRELVLKKFREGQIQVLVATDLAARGLDIDDVSHVINYDLPEEPPQYVHRIGRTGRAGNEGEAISFVTSVAESRMIKQFAAWSASNVEQLPLEIQHGWPRGLLKQTHEDRDRYAEGFRGRPRPSRNYRGHGAPLGAERRPAYGHRGPAGERPARPGFRGEGSQEYGERSRRPARPPGHEGRLHRPEGHRPEGEHRTGGERGPEHHFREHRPRPPSGPGIEPHKPHAERGTGERPAGERKPREPRPYKYRPPRRIGMGFGGMK